MLIIWFTVLLAQTDPAVEAAPAPAKAPEAAAPSPEPSAPAGERAKAAERSPEELARAAEQKRLNAAPVAVPEVKDYAALPEVSQVRYSAREFFTQLIAGDARGIVSVCGFPFQLEERRLQTPDELFQEWLRNLRAKRTDLLTLYDVEVLSPADMEKKYGKPPARLANLPWKNGKTYLAVANLSGRAAVAVFRQQGPSWAVVGYAD